MIKKHKGVSYYLFYGGYFSNWYPCYFIVNGVQYNSSEQYMMAAKAVFFGDTRIHALIMRSKDPAEQKAYGREVENFDAAKWSEVSYDIVKDGLRAKFTQNDWLKKYLIFYSNCTFVEVSPTDRILGVGFNYYDAMKNINKWGQNLLGKALNDIANELT